MLPVPYSNNATKWLAKVLLLVLASFPFFTFNAQAVNYNTLTLDVYPSGAGTVSGAGTYVSGSTVYFSATATPGGCFVFDKWTTSSGSTYSTDASTSIVLTGNRTRTANFILAGPYSITSSVVGSGGTITASGSVSCGGSKTFTITPNSCYAVSSVLVDGASVGAVTSYTFSNVVAAGHTISATFTASVGSYTITSSAGSGGTITASGSVSCGGSKTFTITPNSCYAVSSVLVDGASVGAVTSYTFSNVVAAGHTISATFSAAGPFTITSSAGSGGTITASGSVSCNGSKTFTITPNSCYAVSSVLVDGVSVGAVTSYTFSNVVAAGHTISATFSAAGPFTITSSTGSGGTITASGSVSCNGSKTFTITPNSGYSVESVLVDGAAVTIPAAGGSYTFSNVTANHTIAASFVLKTFTITASAGTGGAISPSGSVSLNYGANQAFIISPNTGYSVTSVLVDGAAVTIPATGGTYTFSNVTANHSISATFTLQTFTITASAGTGGTISPSGSVSVNYGETRAFTISPSIGYSVASVLVDGSAVNIQATGGTYTFTAVTTGHSIAATFALQTFTITASAGTGGTISPSGTVTVNYGDAPVFTLTPSTDYSVDKVQVDGSYISLSGNTYAFPPVYANHTIQALFKKTSGGGGGQSGSSFIPGCVASAYKGYSGGFNAADFSMNNAAVSSNGTIVLQTGAQAIDPNSIIIPFEQTVGVTFLYENAGYTNSSFGWILASDPNKTKHEVYHHIVDESPADGILDGAQVVALDGTSYVAVAHTYNNVLDNRVVLNRSTAHPEGVAFAAGTELVFYLQVDDFDATHPQYTCYTKQAWNTDTFNPSCSTQGTFSKTFYLGNASGSPHTDCGPNQWLDAGAVTRLAAAPLFLNLTNTTKIITNTRGATFPHVIIGAPADKPNEWILGWEDLYGGGDYDLNDMVFRIDRQTGGSTQLQSAQAITSADPNAYFTAVTFKVYDNMPCSGSQINYSLSVDNGVNWTDITDWDTVNRFSSSGGTKTVGNAVSNWTPGSPAMTYRTRRVDFSGVMQAGRQLIWKAVMFSPLETCIPEIIDVSLTGNMASHSFFSRASPSVQTNVLYSGSYESPDASWTDKVFRGHLFASRLYDPADPSQQNVQSLWDAGAMLNAMLIGSRKIYYPDITMSTVVNVNIGTGDGTNKHFSGTLAHSPISATSVKITDGYEIFVDKHTDALEGSRLGTGKINRFTGAYDFNFFTAPYAGSPIVASYTYYTKASVSGLKPFTTDYITNAMLGLDDTPITDDTGATHYKYDLNHSGTFTEDDGAWLVNWVRGYKDGVSTRKEWLLGQIDHSVPAVETPPGRPAWYYGTSVTQAERTSFDTFVSAKWERPTAVYVGSRDGMLHAFDGGKFRWGYMDGGVFKWGDNPATSTITEYRGYFKWDVNGIPDYGTGNELWAFIPSNLISRLKNNLLLGQDQAYVDASPALSDVYINNSWKTVLLSAEGSGGDTVFCLDVTDPLNPTFMWEFADPDLFRSQSSPAVAVVGRINTGGTSKWVAFFVSGKTYDNTLYPSIYMIDIADGSVLQRIFLDSVTSGVGGVPSGQPAVVDSDGNGFIDRIYIGTDKGYLYKVTIPDNPSGSSSYGITNCVINTDATFPSGVVRHPIYASPAVVVQNTYSSSGAIDYKIKILFGTGDSPYLEDSIAGTIYHFFAYVDTAKKEVCNDGTNVSLDWFYALPAGERIFASAFAAAGSIYFGTATSETEDPCEGAGNPTSNSGKLYVMNITQTGTPAPTFTKNTGNILSAPVVDDQHIYVKTVGNGMMTTPGPYNNPVIMGGLVETSVSTWREIFGKDQSLVPTP